MEEEKDDYIKMEEEKDEYKWLGWIIAGFIQLVIFAAIIFVFYEIYKFLVP